MSGRSSWVTDYIYCCKCFDAAKKILSGNDKHWIGIEIPSWCDQTTPIMAGKVEGIFSGESSMIVEHKVKDLAEHICKDHEVRVCVLDDNGTHAIFICDKSKSCDHDWVSTDNKVVFNTDICTKCHIIKART